MRVPFTNTTAWAVPERDQIKRRIAEAAETGDFILKAHAARLEAGVRELTGAAHAVAVASGTDGLKLGLAAVGVGRGDEVIVPAFGYPAVPNAVVQRGAVPVFADIDSRTGCLDPAAVEEHLTSLTKAVVPVHSLSCAADMPAVRAVADAAGLPTVEDAAVCLGGRVGGRRAGRWGTVGVYSTYSVKPLAGIGDGGVIVTDDPDLATRCRMLRNHGQDGVTRFLHHVVGYNSRVDELAAGFLADRLVDLPAALARRGEIAAGYTAAFADFAPALELPPAGSASGTWHGFVVLTDDRDRLRDRLHALGVEARVRYAPLLPFHPAFAGSGHRAGDLPGAKRFVARHLALPLYPELADEQVEAVITAVRGFFSTSADSSSNVRRARRGVA